MDKEPIQDVEDSTEKMLPSSQSPELTGVMEVGLPAVAVDVKDNSLPESEHQGRKTVG